MEQLLFEGLLVERPNDGRPLIALGDAEGVRQVYRGQRDVVLRTPPAKADASLGIGGRSKRRSGRPRARAGEAAGELGPAAELFEALRAWRRETAARQGVPPYVIFHDQTLIGIAKAKPRASRDLLAIDGVGQGKLDRYGEAVLEIVAAA